MSHLLLDFTSSYRVIDRVDSAYVSRGECLIFLFISKVVSMVIRHCYESKTLPIICGMNLS